MTRWILAKMREACGRAGIDTELAPLLLKIGWSADRTTWPTRLSASELAFIDCYPDIDACIARRDSIANDVQSGELRGYYKTTADEWLTPAQYLAYMKAAIAGEPCEDYKGRIQMYPYVDAWDYVAWRKPTTPENKLLTLLLKAAPPVRSNRGAPRKADALHKQRAAIQLDAERIYRELKRELGHPPKKFAVAERLAEKWPSYSAATLERSFHLPKE